MTPTETPDRSTTVPTTMPAVVADAYGPPERLAVREVAVPAPRPGQVLVRVHGSSLNVADWHLATGTPAFLRLVAGLRRPRQPVCGSDVAGVVAAVGAGVTGFAHGDAVYGSAMGAGGFAAYAAVSAGALAPAPPSLDLVTAGAVPLAAVTALQALAEIGGLRPGGHVLVNGASGGVGTFAVQIARALGAGVTAVCSARNVEQARALGADRVIDYGSEDFADGVRHVDVLFDNVGDRPWRDLRRVLSPGGRVVSVSGPKDGPLGPLPQFVGRKLRSLPSGRSFVWFTAATTTERLRAVGELIERGEVTPVVERTVGLDEVPGALGELGRGHARGKTVVRVAG